MIDFVHGDVLEWAKTYDGPKFHAMLCDPPYHLVSPSIGWDRMPENMGKPILTDRSRGGFMGKRWDGGDIAFRPETWAALGEHLLPGAFGMAFSGARTYHRMACAIEDAGFVLHSLVGWIYGSGFPKSTRIDSQIDKGKRRDYVRAAIKLGLDIPGNNLDDWTRQDHIPGDKWWAKFKAVLSEDDWQAIEREVVGHYDPRGGSWYTSENDITAPATDLARTWAGHRYGLQALKPALEPICVFQKPYAGRPVDSITKYGAGALWVEGGRIAGIPPSVPQPAFNSPTGQVYGFKCGEGRNGQMSQSIAGRWPSNLVLDPIAAAALGRMSGERPSGGGNGHRSAGTGNTWDGSSCGLRNERITVDGMGASSGSASRFFQQCDWALEQAEPMYYCSKASRRERDAGLDNFERIANDWQRETSGMNQDRPNREGRKPAIPPHNPHPTVKPLSLARYLATLLAPPVEYAPRRILVPFSGVGSECLGAALSGGWEEIVGIEAEAEYVEMARARAAHWCGESLPLFAAMAEAAS